MSLRGAAAGNLQLIDCHIELPEKQTLPERPAATSKNNHSEAWKKSSGTLHDKACESGINRPIQHFTKCNTIPFVTNKTF